MRAILIEGASTSYGMDAGNYGGWAAQLHRDRQDHNQRHRKSPEVVVNRSLPGLTLPYFNREFPSVVPNYVSMTHGQSVRVLSVGLNEAKITRGNLRPNLPLGRFAVQLERYADDSAKFNLPTVYVGTQPVDETRTRPVPATGSMIEDDLLEEYTELVRNTAHETNMPFVDVRALFGRYALNEVLAQDGYHPNEHGHRLIHAGVQEALNEVGFPIP